MSPSMVDGKIVRLSVSQLSRFDIRERGGCKRKWWFRYIGKIPDPPSAAQAAGSAGHKRLEDYYNGKPVVFFDCDVPALAHLPALSDGAKPEVALEKLTCLSIPFQGSMDLLHGRDVYDYKYQAQILAYSEPTAQLWGYLEEVRRRDDTGGRLGFHYIYIKKGPPYRAEKGSHYFEPREVERHWLTYGSLVAEMQQCAAETDVNKVEANKGACYAYGPCPYLSICNRNAVSPKEELEIMGFLDDLAAAKKNLPVVSIPEVSAALKLLPPDAPPPDATPTAPSAPAPEAKKRGRPKKLLIDDKVSNEDLEREVPDGRPEYAPKPSPPVLDGPRLKSMRLGLTIGLPEYSSAHVFVELEGASEEAMAEEAHTMITRRLEKLIPAYTKALELKNGKKIA